MKSNAILNSCKLWNLLLVLPLKFFILLQIFFTSKKVFFFFFTVISVSIIRHSISSKHYLCLLKSISHTTHYVIFIAHEFFRNGEYIFIYFILVFNDIKNWVNNSEHLKLRITTNIASIKVSYETKKGHCFMPHVSRSPRN